MRILGLTLLAGLLAAPAFAANPADGTWTLQIDCPRSGSAKAYTKRYTAVVANGVLRAEEGTKGTGSFTALDGTIDAAGRADIKLTGITGEAAYAQNNVKSGTPYTRKIEAQFGPGSATGTQLGQRECNFRGFR